MYNRFVYNLQCGHHLKENLSEKLATLERATAAAAAVAYIGIDYWETMRSLEFNLHTNFHTRSDSVQCQKPSCAQTHCEIQIRFQIRIQIERAFIMPIWCISFRRKVLWVLGNVFVILEFNQANLLEISRISSKTESNGTESVQMLHNSRSVHGTHLHECLWTHEPVYSCVTVRMNGFGALF